MKTLKTFFVTRRWFYFTPYAVPISSGNTTFWIGNILYVRIFVDFNVSVTLQSKIDLRAMYFKQQSLIVHLPLTVGWIRWTFLLLRVSSTLLDNHRTTDGSPKLRTEVSSRHIFPTEKIVTVSQLTFPVFEHFALTIQHNSAYKCG